MSAASGRLAFSGVSKRFVRTSRHQSDVEALRDVSFVVEPDSSLGVIGANGAGKSTVLKLAAGVTAPTSGRIERRGQTVAVIELGAGVHPDLTGRENIDLLMALSFDGRSRKPRAFDDIVEFAELGGVIDQPARHYSTGMVARLAFAVAAHATPAILLIDEVLSVGDLSFQQRCRDRIFELRSAGTTVVVVSHDLGLVGATCDRAMLLAGGEIDADGTTDAVIRRYLGRPASGADDPEISLQLAADTVEAGDLVEIDVEPPATVARGMIRFDLITATHVPLQQEQGMSIVCGKSRLTEMPVGPFTARLGTRDLPPGRYEVHVTAEDAQSRTLASGRAAFTLVGPPGPVAIRLRSSVQVDGRAAGRTG